jgi:hypothetical protein
LASGSDELHEPSPLCGERSDVVGVGRDDLIPIIRKQDEGGVDDVVGADGSQELPCSRWCAGYSGTAVERQRGRLAITSPLRQSYEGMRTAILIVGLVALACASDGSGGVTPLAGATPCEKWTSLAAKVGCRAPGTNCSVATACFGVASGWLECVARDLSQCICEPDGDLNCEGSFKPNEGPAKCIAEFGQFDACDQCSVSCDAGPGDQ